MKLHIWYTLRRGFVVCLLSMSLFSFYEFVFFPSISLTCGLGREVGARGERARGGSDLSA